MDTNFNLDAWKNLQHTIKKLKVALRELKEVKVLPIDAQDKTFINWIKKFINWLVEKKGLEETQKCS